MSLFQKLLGLLKGNGSGSQRALWIYVECDHCHEALSARIDLYNDLSLRYGESEADTTYYVRKVLIGSSGCYRPVEVELSFDSQRQVVAREIRDGRFLSEEEYAERTESPS